MAPSDYLIQQTLNEQRTVRPQLTTLNEQQEIWQPMNIEYHALVQLLDTKMFTHLITFTKN